MYDAGIEGRSDRLGETFSIQEIVAEAGGDSEDESFDESPAFHAYIREQEACSGLH